MSLGLRTLALNTGLSPSMNIHVDLGPNKMGCDKSLGGSNSRMGERVECIKHLAAKCLRYEGSRNASRSVTYDCLIRLW